MEILNVINTRRAINRYQQMEKNWSSYFSLQRFEAVTMKDKSMACKLSHLTLIGQLRQQTERQFHLIAEDDVYPTEHFANIWPIVHDYIQTHDDWDIISLDPILHHDFCNIRATRNPNLYQLEKFRSAGFVIYRHQFLQTLDLNYYERCFGSLDMTLFHERNVRKLTPTKLLVKQYEGSSIRTGKGTHHRWDLTEQELLQEGYHPVKGAGVVVGLLSMMTYRYIYAAIIIFFIAIISFLVWWHGDEKYNFDFFNPIEKGFQL